MLTATQSKICRCGRHFVPMNTMQVVCSTACALRKVRADKQAKEKADRAETKRRKEAMKRIPELIREAQVAFNAWVRARDEKQPCISCGKAPSDMTELHAGRDAGHYRSTGSAPHLRYQEDNCHAQCVKCNQWKAGNAVDYRLGLIARIGVARVDALERNNTAHKWTREELIEIRDSYRRRLKDQKRAKQ